MDGETAGNPYWTGRFLIQVDVDGRETGGWGEIRTHGTLAGTPVFKTGALNHSATHPEQENQAKTNRGEQGELPPATRGDGDCYHDAPRPAIVLIAWPPRRRQARVARPGLPERG